MAKKGPLKKVVREFGVSERNFHGVIRKGHFIMEELECGHIIPKPTDLYGEYDASKRRCTQCAAWAALAQRGELYGYKKRT